MVADETFGVHGLHCESCENRLKTALSRADGVIRSNATFRTGRVRVRFDPHRISADEVTARIRTAGYGVVEHGEETP